MKTLKTLLFTLGIIVIMALGCKKNNDNSIQIEDSILKIKDLSFSGCKQTSKSAENNEYLEYFTVDSNYLFIRHVNASLNCCPDSIKVVSSILNGKIQYSVCQKEAICNCNCLYDITCKIGPLAFTSYSMIINVCTGSTAEFKIDFCNNTNGKYIIKTLSK